MSLLTAYVGDQGGIVGGHSYCGTQREVESQQSFFHCSHFQKIDVKSLFLWLPFALKHVSFQMCSPSHRAGVCEKAMDWYTNVGNVKYVSFKLMLYIHIPGRKEALMDSADSILKCLGFKNLLRALRSMIERIS